VLQRSSSSGGGPCLQQALVVAVEVCAAAAGAQEEEAGAVSSWQQQSVRRPAQGDLPLCPPAGAAASGASAASGVCWGQHVVAAVLAERALQAGWRLQQQQWA
jgi:hypothetical protein